MASVIVKNPAVLSGEPVFRGTQVPFKALTDYLEGGEILGEFLEQYPSVTRGSDCGAGRGAGQPDGADESSDRRVRAQGDESGAGGQRFRLRALFVS
jgi:hypothetical protein